MDNPAGRVTILGASAISLAGAGTFFAAARWTGEAPLVAIWGGTVWVFLLSAIITLPLVAGWIGTGRSGTSRDAAPMDLTLGLALCTLPLVFLLVAPWLGLRVAIGAAVAVLAGLSIVCWILCASGRPSRAGSPR